MFLDLPLSQIIIRPALAWGSVWLVSGLIVSTAVTVNLYGVRSLTRQWLQPDACGAKPAG